MNATTVEASTVNISVSASTAYALCSCVDSGTTVPFGWEECWVPDGDNNGAYAIVFQAYIPVVIVPWNPPVRIPIPFYALAIQGTKDIQDLIRDFEIVPVPFAPIDEAEISKGANKQLTDVLGLIRTTEETVETLQDFLSSLTSSDTLLVTGHSLGGQCASVITPWAAFNLPAFGADGQPLEELPANLSAITFAAPTAGNQAFASFLNNQGTKYQANFNLNDIVPHVWSLTGQFNIDAIYTMFPVPGPSPAPDLVKGILDFKKAQLKIEHATYIQTNGTVFQGTIQSESGQEDPWLAEVGYQHNTAYSIQFLGAGTAAAGA